MLTIAPRHRLTVCQYDCRSLFIELPSYGAVHIVIIIVLQTAKLTYSPEVGTKPDLFHFVLVTVLRLTYRD